jgi:hypothetical protein
METKSYCLVVVAVLAIAVSGMAQGQYYTEDPDPSQGARWWFTDEVTEPRYYIEDGTKYLQVPESMRDDPEYCGGCGSGDTYTPPADYGYESAPVYQDYDYQDYDYYDDYDQTYAEDSGGGFWSGVADWFRETDFSISASWGYGDPVYYPHYGYYGYAPTYYTTGTPDVVYASQQQQTVDIDYVQLSQPHQETSLKVYHSCPDGDCDDSDSQDSTQAYCGDGTCSLSESQHSCPADCTPDPYCGDGVCSAGETEESCSYDCSVTATSTSYCGDGVCEGSETKHSCPDDCGMPNYCGDGECAGAETQQSCPEDCGLAPYCGDGNCDKDETKYNCAIDCGLPPYCGDGECNGVETKYTCSQDCGEPSCTNPSGDVGDTVCTGREILICQNGFWEHYRPVQCCNKYDCPPGYSCRDNACERTSICGDGYCTNDETYATCPTDCTKICIECDDTASPQAYCGDGECSGSETCATCPGDCGRCYYCGDGVCNTQSESQQSCPEDCGQSVDRAIDLEVGDECQEIEQGESGSFDLIVYNNGNAVETVTFTASGSTAPWLVDMPTVTIPSGESKIVGIDIHVPEEIEPGLYNLTMHASNSRVQDLQVLKVDVKLPPIENATVVSGTKQTSAAAGRDETSTTGAIIAGDIVISEWVLLFALILIMAALFIFLLNSKSGRKSKSYVLTTDGGWDE